MLTCLFDTASISAAAARSADRAIFPMRTRVTCSTERDELASGGALAAVADRLVGDGELREVVADHLGLHFDIDEQFSAVSPTTLPTISGTMTMILKWVLTASL